MLFKIEMFIRVTLIGLALLMLVDAQQYNAAHPEVTIVQKVSP